MHRIGSSLKEDGYRVVYWTYPTLNHSISEHATNFCRDFRKLTDQAHISQVHFVGHSMGCIIIRAALEYMDLPTGSRFVMLAPPNSGSRLTRFPIGPFAKFFPQLSEMSESPESFVNRLPEPSSVAVGILAAGRDWVVDAESTYLATQRDHQIIDTTHQRLPASDGAVKQVRQFLANGQFDHAWSTSKSGLFAA